MSTDQSTMTLEPTTEETPTLASCEAVIDRGMGTFVEVGEALATIRDCDLYREAGFATFADYCKSRYAISLPYAYRMIAASGIVRDDLSPIGDNGNGALPKTESVARPLSLLETPEERTEAWKETVELHGDAPTAADVREVVSRRKRGGTTVFPAGEEPQPTVIDVQTSPLAEMPEQLDSALVITVADDIAHAFKSWPKEKPDKVADRLKRSMGGQTNARRRVQSLADWLAKVAGELSQG